MGNVVVATVVKGFTVAVVLVTVVLAAFVWDAITDIVTDGFAMVVCTGMGTEVVGCGDCTATCGWVHPATRKAEITIAMKIRITGFRTKSPFYSEPFRCF